MKTNTILIISLSLSLSSIVQGALLVYEPFDFALSNNGDNGDIPTTQGSAAGTGFGLAGSWQANDPAGTATYNTTSLTFGNFFASSAGSVVLSGFGGGSQRTIGAQLDTGSVTGTLYTSYLIQFAAISTASTGYASTRVNTDGIITSGAAGQAHFWTIPENTNGAGVGTGVTYENVNVTDVGSIKSSPNVTGLLTTNTTYLVVTRFTNVGNALSAGNPGVARLWLFDQTGYDGWQLAGGAEGSLSDWALSSVMDTRTSGTFGFDSDSYLQLTVYNGGSSTQTQTAIFDELRWGTTLGDVMQTVPEPGLTTLAVLGGFCLLMWRQKGSRRSGRPLMTQML